MSYQAFSKDGRIKVEGATMEEAYKKLQRAEEGRKRFEKIDAIRASPLSQMVMISHQQKIVMESTIKFARACYQDYLEMKGSVSMDIPQEWMILMEEVEKLMLLKGESLAAPPLEADEKQEPKP